VHVFDALSFDRTEQIAPMLARGRMHCVAREPRMYAERLLRPRTLQTQLRARGADFSAAFPLLWCESRATQREELDAGLYTIGHSLQG
jgi:hypothetical protein